MDVASGEAATGVGAAVLPVPMPFAAPEADEFSFLQHEPPAAAAAAAAAIAPQRKWRKRSSGSNDASCARGAQEAGGSRRAPRKLKAVVFCDLDGCLVDFDGGVEQLTGMHPRDAVGSPEDSTRMWECIEAEQSFYQTLPWMPDGRQLWRFLTDVTRRHADEFEPPIILSGLPRFVEQATRGKKVGIPPAASLAVSSPAVPGMIVGAYSHASHAPPTPPFPVVCR